MAKEWDDAWKGWWDADADRLNALADSARANGITVGEDRPAPKLNPDGSLAEDEGKED